MERDPQVDAVKAGFRKIVEDLASAAQIRPTPMPSSIALVTTHTISICQGKAYGDIKPLNLHS